MLDHVGLDVRDYEESKRFYEQALQPLGYRLLLEFDGGACGFGKDGKPDFWIARRGEPQQGVHVAFVAPDRAGVDAFHATALAAGGEDNGAPGLRPLYHQDYYAAYVLDPDRNNVEAVFHGPAT